MIYDLSSPHSQIIDAEKNISNLRLHKNALEIENLKKAIQISEQALSETTAQLKLVYL